MIKEKSLLKKKICAFKINYFDIFHRDNLITVNGLIILTVCVDFFSLLVFFDNYPNSNKKKDFYFLIVIFQSLFL